jgi:ATP-dependent exoDNAse (exonuclease V) alpha subunit
MRVDSYQFPDGNKIHFYQIPLKLCYAVTAHKAQGQTLSKVAVSIMDPAFAHGPFYVAVSRVRRLADLMLFGTVEFPDDGPDFHLNRFIQDIDHAFEGPHEL